MTQRFGTFVVAIVLFAVRPAAAQGVPYADVSFSATQGYEDNLFTVPFSRRPQSDLVYRFGPAFEAGYVSLRRSLVVRYAIASERYLEHVALNRTVARQDAGIDFHQRVSRRLAVDTRASFLETHTPNELNTLVGLVVGRARATRAAAATSAVYNWTPQATLTIGYSFARDVLQGRPTTRFHEIRVDAEARRSERHAGRIGYRFQQFAFDDRDSDTSFSLMGGWSLHLAPLTTVTIDAGPRFSARAVRPELSVSVRRHQPRGELSASFTRTLATAIGESGSIELQRVGLAVIHRPSRRLTLTAAPAFISATHGPERASVYAMDLDAAFHAGRSMTVAMTARFGLQEFLPMGRYEDIRHRRLSVTIAVAPPRSARGPRNRRVGS